jgi:hypothetical protein
MDLRVEIIDRDNLGELRGEPGRNRAPDEACTTCYHAGASHPEIFYFQARTSD